MSSAAHDRTRIYTTAALFAALIAISAWLSIPVGEVPITLQTSFVALAGLLLAPLPAFAAVGVYLLLGLAGLPVFAGGKAGLAVLAGPTGGFLLGFLVGAWACSLVRTALERRFPRLVADIAGALALTLAVYAFGTAQLIVVTGMTPAAALAAGVLPFIAGDVLKAAAAVALAGVLRKALPR